MKMNISSDNNTLAIVTGAAKGNGKIIADSLENSGATVIRVDLLKSVTDAKGKCLVGGDTDELLIKKVFTYYS